MELHRRDFAGAVLASAAGLSAPARAAMENAPTVTEAKVAAALTRLDDMALEAVKNDAPGLAVAVVHQDKVAYLKGFGVREVDKPEPVDADTVFQLASMSKPIASTIVSAVVGDGTASWDDPVVKHLPDFRLNDPYVTEKVTLRDMFSHRSGLPAYAGDNLEELGLSGDAVIRNVRFLPLGDRFRSTYAYTNYGLSAAAFAAAKAAGKSWAALAEERIYAPLGMTSTSYRYEDFLKRPNRAGLHVPINGRWVAKFQVSTDEKPPSGGVSSSVRDLAQWVRLQLNGGKVDGKTIVGADALAETHRPMILRTSLKPSVYGAEFYGLGWMLTNTNVEGNSSAGRARLYHSGDFSQGASTTVFLVPEEGLGIVVLTNGQPRGVPQSIAMNFLDLAQFGAIQERTRNWVIEFKKTVAEIFNAPNPYAKPTLPRSDALPSGAYVGAYANDFVGRVEVVEKDGALTLLVAKAAYPLAHFNRDLFTLNTDDIGVPLASGVTFTIGLDGKATGVRIDSVDTLGQGLLTRVNA